LVFKAFLNKKLKNLKVKILGFFRLFRKKPLKIQNLDSQSQQKMIVAFQSN